MVSVHCQEAVICSKVAAVHSGDKYFLKVKMPFSAPMIRITGVHMCNSIQLFLTAAMPFVILFWL